MNNLGVPTVDNDEMMMTQAANASWASFSRGRMFEGG